MQTFFSGCLIFDKPMWDEEKGTLLHSKWAKLRRSGMLLVTGTKLGLHDIQALAAILSPVTPLAQPHIPPASR
jgi:hypothetical protein